MELTGTIIAIMPAKSGVSARTGNPWMTQEYVIEVPGQYPKKCAFSIFGEDRIKQFNHRAIDAFRRTCPDSAELIHLDGTSEPYECFGPRCKEHSYRCDYICKRLRRFIKKHANYQVSKQTAELMSEQYKYED